MKKLPFLILNKSLQFSFALHYTTLLQYYTSRSFRGLQAPDYTLRDVVLKSTQITNPLVSSHFETYSGSVLTGITGVPCITCNVL